MKVLIASYLLDPRLGGGAVTAAARVCRSLVERGVEVVAVTTHDDARSTVTTEDGIKVYHFRPRNLYWVANKERQPIVKKAFWQLVDVWNPHVYRTVREIIRQEKPDVVHVHKLRGLSPAVWSAAAAEGCRPIVQTCHDYELISPEGSLESTVGRLALRRHVTLRPYQSARARLSDQVDVVTAPSCYTLSTITELGFFGRAHSRVVPNSHGLSRAELARLADQRRRGPQSAGKLNLLYLGRLETIKGIDILCEAFAGIAASLPQARLDIAGSGAREASLREQYSGQPAIHFHGHVMDVAKEALIADADVLVMPSVVREVFGISIVEAYAYGKPVIASRIGGMPELVREGETGLLVEPGDMAGLQQAIRRMAEDPALAQAMSPTCRQAAEAYTMEAVTDGYLAAYAAR